MKLAVAGVICALALKAEVLTNPVHAQAMVRCPVVADATFHVKKMNIEFSQMSYLSVANDPVNVSGVAGQVWNGNHSQILPAIEYQIVLWAEVQTTETRNPQSHMGFRGFSISSSANS